MKKLLLLCLLASTAYGQWTAQPVLTDPVVTGTVTLDNAYYPITSHGNTGSTEDFSALVGFHTATLNANCTVTLSDWGDSAGFAVTMTIWFAQDATGGRTITWPVTVASPAPLINPAASSVTRVDIVTGDLGAILYATSDYGTPRLPISSKSANYTAILTDANTSLYHPASDANARTFTIDSNANCAFPVGTTLTFINLSANNLTISITTDSMTLIGVGGTGSRTLTQYGVATAIKVSSTAWIISGSTNLN